jgi:hypothetical protein
VSHVSEDMVLSVLPQPQIARWLQSELQIVCSVQNAKQNLDGQEVKEGFLYGAKFFNPLTKRHEFHRVKVLSSWKVRSGTKVEVLLVDLGSILTIGKTQLREIAPGSINFQILHAQVDLQKFNTL